MAKVSWVFFPNLFRDLLGPNRIMASTECFFYFFCVDFCSFTDRNLYQKRWTNFASKAVEELRIIFCLQNTWF